MKTNNIPASLIEGMESGISYHHSARMYVKAGVYMALALVAVLVLAFADIDSKSPFYFVFGIAAFMFLLLFVSTMAFTKKEARLVGNGSRIECHTLNFDALPSVVIDDIRNNSFGHLKSLVSKGDGGVRLVMLFSADASVARYRIYKYVPFEYQPVSAVIDLDPAAATSLSRL